ncbi:MAG: hypothetical protein JWR01_2139 [Subtercola sp.]|nr:hypothetical protein [Subtercola sp.]
MTSPSPTERAARTARPQVTLAVVRREQLSPHLVRIVLGGDEFGAFQTNDSTDKYVKLVFTAPGELTVTRTYTVREVDPVARTLSIDFVVHGDEGLAGPWADAAQPGDLLSFAGPGGGYAPDPAADWHLFAGDQSALPAIASALAALPATALGLAFVEVTGAADELVLDAPAGVAVTWIHSAPGVTLAAAVDGAEWLAGRPQVFAHGERESMKELREVFKRRGVLRSELSLSGYWAAGRTEDRFQAEKREPVGVIEPV